jgi:putative redox protein
MSEVKVVYEGGDRCDVSVRGHHFNVDLPPGLGGGDTAPSAAEVFIGSLLASMTIFGQRFLKSKGVDPTGFELTAAYTVSLEWPMRVQWIDIELALPSGVPDDLIEPLQKVIGKCTVQNSLNEPPNITLTLREPKAA